MNKREQIRISKFLSLILRHQPETIGIQLDDNGWVEVAVLLAQCKIHKKGITQEILAKVVATNTKQRFALSEDGLRIRANQGHSIDVDLGYKAQRPPEELYHGTVAGSLSLIRNHGLSKMLRHHVHLSPDRQTAVIVGKRRGKPMVLSIQAAAMANAGYDFFLSTNGVWLTEHVPTEFIRFPDFDSNNYS